MDGLQPLVQRGVAVLEHRADADRELLAAMAALLEAVALDAFRVLLAGLGADALQGVDAIHAAAMRADRTIRPEDGLQLGEGRFFVMKMLCVQYRHGLSPLFSLWTSYLIWTGL